MFTLEVNQEEEVLTLIYQNDKCKFRLTPEEPLGLPSVILPDGEFTGTTSNGTFYLRWSPEEVECTVAKYGNGMGGDLCVTVPYHPSLLTALEEWSHTAEEWYDD